MIIIENWIYVFEGRFADWISFYGDFSLGAIIDFGAGQDLL